MNVDNPKAAELYTNLINDGYTSKNLGSVNDFAAALSDPTKADKIYSGLMNDGYTEKNLGSQKDFMQTFQNTPQGGNGFSAKINQSVPQPKTPLPFNLEQKPQPTQQPADDFGFNHNQTALNQQPTSDNTTNTAPQQAENKVDFDVNYQQRQQRQQQINQDAIKNTVQKSLALKGITAQPGSAIYNEQQANYQKQIADGDATIVRDKNGVPGLSRTTGIFENWKNNWNQTQQANKEAAQFTNDMTPEQMVDYLHKKQVQPPSEYVGTTPSLLGSASGFVAQNAPFVGKAVVGGAVGAGLAALAPESMGATMSVLPKVMSFIFTAHDAATQGAQAEITRQFYINKQQHPDWTDVQAMTKAKEDGKTLGIASGLATNALLMNEGGDVGAGVKNNVVDNGINVIKSSIKGAGKIAGVDAAKEVYADVKDGATISNQKLIDDVGDSFKNNATTLGLLHIATRVVTGGLKLPKILNSAIKFELAKKDPADVDAGLQINTQAGNITPETAQAVKDQVGSFGKTLQTLPDGLSDDSQSSIAGLIEKRKSIEAEALTKDKSDAIQKPYKDKTDAINQQIADIQRTGNPYENEIDEATGKPYQPPTYDDVAQQQVKALADKISKGKAVTEPEDVQTQTKFPDQLKSELQNLSDEEKKANVIQEVPKTVVQDNIKSYLDKNNQTKDISNNQPNNLAENNPVLNPDNSINLPKVKEYADDIEKGTSRIDRLSPSEEQGRTAGGRRNVEASIIASADEGTNSPKEREVEQVKNLTDYAKKEGIWVDNIPEKYGEEIDRGGEANVYHNEGDTHITKVITPYYSEDAADFLDRISLHNHLFPESKYTLEGFGNNDKGEFSFIVKQPFVDSENHASRAEIKADLEQRGFTHERKDDYKNKDYLLEDITPDNVLKDKDGNLHYIDTRASLNTPEYGGGARERGKGNIVITESGKPENTEENNSLNQKDKLPSINENKENGKDTSSKEQTTAGDTEQSGDQPGKSVPKSEKIKVLKKRAKPTIKSPLYRQALESESEDPKSQVLKYFVGGGRISRDALKEFHGDKKGELNAKISLQGPGPKTIDGLAHYFWDNSSEENQKLYDTEDYREAIEDVLGNHNSRTTMAEELIKSVPQDDDLKAMTDWYDQTYGPHQNDIEEPVFNDAINSLEGMSDEEIQKVADNEQESLLQLAKEYSQVTDSDVKEAQSAYDQAKSKLSSAEDKLAKEQAKQSDMFSGGQQKGLFSASREDSKEILDPLRAKLKETKAALDKIQNEYANQNDKQPDLFKEANLNKAEINVAKEKIKLSDAEQIIKDEGLTLGNLKDYKHLFNGFPFEKEDFDNIKNLLNESKPDTAEPAAAGQESAGDGSDKNASDQSETVQEPPAKDAEPGQTEDTKSAGTTDAGDVQPETIESKAGITVPIVDKFFEHDVTPRLEKIGLTMKDAMRGLVNLISPKTGVSEKAITNLMRALGERNAASAGLDKVLSGLEKVFDKMKDEDRISFIDKMKRGDKQLTPQLQEVSDALRALDKNLYNEIAKYKPSITWKENHFRVLWKKIPGSGKTKFWSNLTRRPLQGSKGFFKMATLTDMSEGIANGGEPQTTNPIRMFKLAYADGMKYVTAQRMFEALKKDKMVQFVKTGDRAPDFFVPINDNIAKVYFKSDAGLVKAGEYYIEEGAGRLLNNHLSRDLIREHSVGKGLMEIKNLYTQVELSLSGFHAIAEGLESVSSDLGLGLRKLFNLGTRGDFKMAGDGIMDIIKAPFSPKTTFTLGRNAIKFATEKEFEQSDFGKAWLKKMPDAQQYITDFFNGGGLLKQSEDLRANTFRALKEQAGKSNYIGAALRALPAMNEAILSPLFNYYIPSLKVGMFFKEFPVTLKENAARLEKGDITRDELARKSISFIDDRLGEMNFDNLFWDRTFKTTTQFLMRSVTWKLGNLRAMLGAVPEQAQEFISAAKEKRAPLLMPKMAWLFGLSAMQVALSSVIMKMMANKTPQNFKDVVAPQINPDDDKDRIILPTYYKDLLHLWHSRGGYITTSMSGPISKLFDIWQNKDFYNYEIHDEHDNFLQKRKDDLLYFIPKPFSISSSVQQLESGDGGKAAMSFFGLNKAPGYLTNSDIENEIFDLYNQRNTNVKPKAEKEGNDIKKQIRELYKNDQKQEAQEMADKAVKDGTLRPTQIKYLFSHVGKEGSPAQFFFKELPYEDKKYLVGKMTDEEKKTYDPKGKFATK